MLEYRTAKSQDRYFTWNGKHICSSYSPVKEAESWVSQWKQNAIAVKTLVVLGLGNGYHVVKARAAFPGKKIVVIEAQPNFVAPAEGLHGLGFHNIEIIVAESEAIFKAQSRLARLVSGSYLLLPFQPVMNLNPDLYGFYLEMLTGRTKKALRFQLQQRKSQHGIIIDQRFDQQVDQQLDKLATNDQELLSIKHLETMLEDGADSQQYHLIKALRELVL